MFVFTNSYPKTHEEKRPIKSKALRPTKRTEEQEMYKKNKNKEIKD